MGVVYRARDVALRRDVAVKLLNSRFSPDSPAGRRFVVEAQITAQLQHPGIPAVHEVGCLPDGRPFLAMKLVRGRTLDDLLKERADPSVELGRYQGVIEQVCQAVGYAHAHGVIHRDLKPANIMVGAFGEVQVMDWGLAKSMGRDRPGLEFVPVDPDATLGTEIRATPDSDLETQAGSLLGTPAFMSPEQAIGAVDRIDSRSDVFGLGAVLCVILTGKPPYLAADAESTRQLAARAKLNDAFARLDGCGAEPALVALCRRCLATEQADRPRDAGAVAAAVAALRADAAERARQAELNRVRAEGDQRAAELVTAVERRRRRVVLGAACAVATVLAIGAGGSVWQAVRATDAEGAAKASEGKALDREVKEKAARETAEAVAGFMQEVFAQGSAAGQASPTRGVNRALTVKEAMDYAAKAVDGRFPDRPDLEAAVRSVIGKTYRELAAFPESLAQTERALAIRRRTPGSTHPDTLTGINDLAGLYKSLGRYDEAESLYQEALAGRRAALGDTHRDTLGSLNDLAGLYVSRGRYEDAERFFKEALAGGRAGLGDTDPDTLTCVYHLADLYEVRGRYDEAEPLYNEALAGRRKVLGDIHPHTLSSVNSLGGLYWARGRYDEAESLFKEAIAGNRKVHGGAHPETLMSVSSLGALYWSRQRYDETEPLFKEALAGNRKAFGDTHRNTLTSVNNLALLYMSLGRYAEAEALYKEAVAGYTAALGRGNADTLTSISNLGRLYADQARYGEAEPLYKESLEGRRKTLGDPHPHTLLSLINLGWLYYSLGRYTDAEPLYREAIRGYEKKPPEALTFAIARAGFGLTLLAVGKPSDAEPYLVAGYDGLLNQKVLGKAHRSRLRLVAQALVDVYGTAGNPTEAAAWRAKAKALPPEIAPRPRPVNKMR
jgi:tetratricopeptide (TPR) repeat protein